MIRRRGQRPEEEQNSSSDDEEDAFSALSRKRPKPSNVDVQTKQPTTVEQKSKRLPEVMSEASTETSTTVPQPPPSDASLDRRKPVALTSSMKRHHKPSDTRKAKMDALLEELEAEKNKKPMDRRPRAAPEKKGSYCAPEEEHLTTNIFVGGLSPSVTEEDLTRLFQQFGELYSVKIMWPRTMEERGRNRNTGFVCFMNRPDAEEAITLDDTDPFNSGRLLMLRWGKNVKKDARRDTGRPEDNSIRKKESSGDTKAAVSVIDGDRHSISSIGNLKLSDISKAKPFDAKLHSTDAVRVELPINTNRFHFISSVAKYVATDGLDLERRIMESESGNAQFKFLTLGISDDETQRKEHLFYRWRIYSFRQGDTLWTWRTDPFVMFHPNGRYWIPPPIDEDAARNEMIFARTRAEYENRDKQTSQTGRQLERARNFRRRGQGHTGANDSTLSEEDVYRFQQLVTKELSLSRERICEAMVFCLERCAAANQVSKLLMEALLDDSATVEQRIVRLYLLSDVLYNSQQPGVKNAFLYRTNIENMAPTIFRGLRASTDSANIGRITINKLRKAIAAVLGAWTEWGVFSPTFLDELEGYVEGREPEVEKEAVDMFVETEHEALQEEATARAIDPNEMVSRAQQGDWIDVPQESTPQKKKKRLAQQTKEESIAVVDGNSSEAVDFDGDPGKDVDKEPIEDLDGEDIDGESLGEEDLDGEILDDEDLDDEDFDGEDLDGEDLDGEALDGEDLEQADG